MTLNLIKFFIIIILINSCAQIVNPSGGPTDQIPPKVIGSKPTNKSTNFSSDKIIIKFDEFIQLKDKDQIVISPLIQDNQIETDGKNIIITFLKKMPEPNTTYTINFGNSIADNHEGKTIESYNYIFSTGNYLDSNKIQGNVINSFTTKAEKGIIVGIYPTNSFSDTSIFKNHPAYFTKTNDKGEFNIENLPYKSFELYAFQDDNKDIKYSKNENVAFINSSINPAITKDKVKLLLFKPAEFKNNKLLDTITKQKGKYQFLIYKPEQIKIEPQTKNTYFIENIKTKDQKDTINVFIKDNIDSLPVQFRITTNDTTYTLNLKSKNKSKNPTFIINIIGSLSHLSDSIRLYSSTPIENFIQKNIHFYEDTIEINKYKLIEINKQNWILPFSFKEKTTYNIIIKDSIIKDIYGKYNKELKEIITTKSQKDYGNLILNVKNKINKKLIIQLVEDNADQKVIYETLSNNTQVLNIENINPSIIKIKIIKDLNNNGKWDNGDLNSNQQPEEVFYYNQPITIKAYWDIELTIDIEEIINN